MQKRVEEGTKEEGTWKIFAKYFAHGFAFSLLFLGFGVYFWPRLVFVGIFMFFPYAIIGIVILLFVVVDGLNIFLTWVIWDVKIDTAFLRLLLHGINLLLFLSIMNGIFILLPNFLFPGISTAAITFIVGAFVDGYVGKSVAEWFPRER